MTSKFAKNHAASCFCFFIISFISIIIVLSAHAIHKLHPHSWFSQVRKKNFSEIVLTFFLLISSLGWTEFMAFVIILALGHSYTRSEYNYIIIFI